VWENGVRPVVVCFSVISPAKSETGKRLGINSTGTKARDYLFFYSIRARPRTQRVVFERCSILLFRRIFYYTLCPERVLAVFSQDLVGFHTRRFDHSTPTRPLLYRRTTGRRPLSTQIFGTRSKRTLKTRIRDRRRDERVMKTIVCRRHFALSLCFSSVAGSRLPFRRFPTTLPRECLRTRITGKSKGGKSFSAAASATS